MRDGLPKPAVLTARQTQVLDALGIGRWRRRALDQGADPAQRLPSDVAVVAALDPASVAAPVVLAAGAAVPAPSAVRVAPAGDDASHRGLPVVAERPASAPPLVTGDAGHAVAIPADWDGLRQAVTGCQQCKLCAGRQRTVFGAGAPGAALMIVGEGPGADEDAQGEPFVGRAGKLLDDMLASIGASREDNVFITNVVKCRPPGNRDPEPDEVAACRGYLDRQIELIQPQLILALGRVAAQCLLGSRAPLSRLRGSLHRLGAGGPPLWVTYHPAYLLREPSEKRKSWADLQRVHRLLRDAGAE